MLETNSSMIHALLTYTDWWQPTTTSVMRFSGVQRRAQTDGFREGLLDTLDERTEVCRRMSFLSDKERNVLFLWYVVQLPVAEIAREVRVSSRQCFRVRARAIKTLVELGRPIEAA